jgi:hypothetical protein
MGQSAMYRITGLDNDELRKHVGHQVEVRGKLKNNGGRSSSAGSGATSGTAGSTGSTGATGSTGSAGGSTSGTTSGAGHAGGSGMSARDLPEIDADSIKMVASACSGT